MIAKNSDKKMESKTSHVEPGAEQDRNETASTTTEVTAQILVPHEGRKALLVLFGAFTCIFILDGVVFTFGSILSNIVTDLKTSESLVVLINSTAVALYFLGGPLASAFINRYGFRVCIMTGSVVSSFSLLTSYYSSNYTLLCLFYGVFAGLGYSLINMSSILVVGFHFDKHRSIAMSVATSGSSVGIMILYPVNSYLVKLTSWRSVALLQCGLIGTIFFLGMTFKPLILLEVTKDDDKESPLPSITYMPTSSIPSLSAVRQTKRLSRTSVSTIPNKTERLFKAFSNANFPTATEVKNDGSSLTVPGSSTGKFTLQSETPQGTSSRPFKKSQSITSEVNFQEKKPQITKLHIYEEDEVVRPKLHCWGCCERLCHWEPHRPEARPMYRDDAFYEGKIENLEVYRKSLLDTTEESRTGLEYRMAVSRSVAVGDLNERRGCTSTAFRRVLATMMDPTLMKRYSFLLLCFSGFTTYLGYLVPYVYLQDRNEKQGIDTRHCSFLVSAIGFCSGVGRVLIGFLAGKIDPVKIFSSLYCVAGLSTLCSGLSFNLYFQYAYCCVYGFCIAGSCLRSVIIVSVYGLDKLTNATGMLLIFLGVGNLISTPMASLIKNQFGYQGAFICAGIFIIVSGLLLIPIKELALRNK